MSSTGSTAVNTIFSVLGQHLLSDAESPAFDLLDNFFANVQKNKSIQNVAAQGAILAASAPMQLPGFEQSSIGDFATAGQALLALARKATGQAAS